MNHVTRAGLLAVVAQPKRPVFDLEIVRQEPPPGEPALFREVVLELAAP